MSTSPILTEGFGSFGSVALVVTMGFSSSVAVYAQAPAPYHHVVDAQDRAFTVAAQDRSHVVDAQDRSATIADQDRSHVIDAQDRTH